MSLESEKRARDVKRGFLVLALTEMDMYAPFGERRFRLADVAEWQHGLVEEVGPLVDELVALGIAERDEQRVWLVQKEWMEPAVKALDTKNSFQIGEDEGRVVMLSSSPVGGALLKPEEALRMAAMLIVMAEKAGYEPDVVGTTVATVQAIRRLNKE